MTRAQKTFIEFQGTLVSRRILYHPRMMSLPEIWYTFPDLLISPVHDGATLRLLPEMTFHLHPPLNIISKAKEAKNM